MESDKEVLLGKNSNIIIENSTFNFSIIKSKAFLILLDCSNITLRKVSIYNFNSSGSAIALYNRSHVVFEDKSNATFYKITNHDYIIFLRNHSSITFDGNSKISFNNTIGTNGAIYLKYWCNIIFQGKSVVSFNNNSATNGGGAIFLQDHSSITFRGDSNALFNHNKAAFRGGAILAQNLSSIAFKGNSTISFTNNKAVRDGGAIYLHHRAILDFNGFQNHTNINITFEENSTVHFINNTATSGGALYLDFNSSVVFEGNSYVSFKSNNASFDGGAIYSQGHNSLVFTKHSSVSFMSNIATYVGGAVYLCYDNRLIFKGASKVSFTCNKANDGGGAIFSIFHSSVIFTGHSIVTFNKNIAAENGGALRTFIDSLVTFDDNTEVSFIQNHAGNNGGAMDVCSNTNITFQGNSTVTFNNNNASADGGACAYASVVRFMDNAIVNFTSNIARSNGGALMLSSKFDVTFEKAKLMFKSNRANYGGAILGDFSDRGTVNFTTKEIGEIDFHNNIALTRGNSMLIDISNMITYNKSWLANQVHNDNSTTWIELKRNITSPPFRIKLNTQNTVQQNETICSSANHSDDRYNTCFENHVIDSYIMLGQEIVLNGCLYDLFDNPINAEMQFEIDSANDSFNVRFHENPSISCNSSGSFHFCIYGNNINTNYNLSINITVRPLISSHLLIQLLPCHFGFQYHEETEICECYDEDNIVMCNKATSSIKRGYWLGTVNSKLTTTICPINYCNFTCCETSNGYHSLSPDRENSDQCTSHRSGIACGSCEEGYTLSYGADCVSVDKCTAGWTILAVTLTILYWIAIVVGAFAMMHYKLPIGYLYALTYYYSIVDALLGQYLYLYTSLHITINIFSSIFQLSPQFLRRLCLTKNLSGIDIHFIHYIHPIVVSIILVKITLLARCSPRLSLFVARGIIRVICFLLLLSYTSIATNSLLLIRSLKFWDINETYTYLSPDLEYLHGRHLVYFIVAVICIITVVIGLPLILLLEPFLNRKINFIKIKPLLDQFQGCFKDRYRWFASYYMICRLLQIAIIVYSTDFFITQYFVIVVNLIIALVHVTLKPYNNNTLNVFDGLILHFMILVAIIPIFDTLNSKFIIAITFILILLPLLVFLILGLIIHNKIVRKLIIKTRKAKNTVEDNNERSVKEFGMTIDESMRTNATVCDL